MILIMNMHHRDHFQLRYCLYTIAIIANVYAPIYCLYMYAFTFTYRLGLQFFI